MDLSALETLGLSPTEIKVYAALLRLGEAKAGALIKATGVQNSVMHLTLGRLAAAGIISYVRAGSIRIYQAVPPARLLQIADERRTALAELVPKLESSRKKSNAPEAEIFEGMRGLRSMCLKLIEGVAQGSEFLFFAFHVNNEEWEREVYKFYREYTEIRLQRGLRIRGVAHENHRAHFLANRWPHRDIRFVDFPILKSISVCANRTIIVPWEEAQVSFLIRSSSYADNLRDYFNQVWHAGRQ
jgi:sugar-specific transcriptional regulator TrmB